jgi:hypothetical protein
MHYCPKHYLTVHTMDHRTSNSSLYLSSNITPLFRCELAQSYNSCIC